ncbi:hypothetical protein OC844_000290 [Tilletia horrida]|nr:hypothetical protein OC844_000290 [Tilletia horrida]
MSSPSGAGHADSAALRVLLMPELVFEILRHLERDTADLLTLSTVCRQYRALVLPFLVRFLDVPLTRADSFRAFLETAPPAVVDSVEFLRIREDEARTKFHHRKHSAPTAHEAPADPTFWKWEDELSKVLPLIEQRRRQPLPLVDLSMSLSDATYVRAIFSRTPKLQKRICALRVLVDIDETDYEVYESAAEVWLAVQSTASLCWDLLAETVQSIASDHLVTFELDNSATYGDGEDGFEMAMSLSAPDAFWRYLAAHLPATVQDLSLIVSEKDIDTAFDLGGYRDFLGKDWPALRKMHISFPRISAPEGPEANEVLGLEGPEVFGLLRRTGETIESVSINLPEFRRTSRSDFRAPKLRSIAGKWYIQPEGGQESLFGQGRAVRITEWDLSELPLADAKKYLFKPVQASLLANMRVLRASIEVAEHYLQAGARPAHIQLAAGKDLASLRLESWLAADAKAAAAAVTCLDLEVEAQTLAEMTPALGATFSASHFPKLQELNICSTAAVTETSASDGPATQLHSVLSALQSSSALRAIRIEHMGAALFPPGHLEHLVEQCPPALEYVSWHVPTRNVTQYYRVVWADGRVRRLQRLSPSFRVKVRADGVWEQPTELRRGAVLFDHARDGPPALVLS